MTVNTQNTKLKRSKWEGHMFSTGPYAGKDYITFEKDSKTDLKKMLKEEGLKLHNFSKNHYCFTAVVTDGLEHFIYISQSDVRWSDLDRILIRTMKHDKDWTGGHNRYCRWEEVGKRAKQMIESLAN